MASDAVWPRVAFCELIPGVIAMATQEELELSMVDNECCGVFVHRRPVATIVRVDTFVHPMDYKGGWDSALNFSSQH